MRQTRGNIRCCHHPLNSTDHLIDSLEFVARLGDRGTEIIKHGKALTSQFVNGLAQLAQSSDESLHREYQHHHNDKTNDRHDNGGEVNCAHSLLGLPITRSLSPVKTPHTLDTLVPCRTSGEQRHEIT